MVLGPLRFTNASGGTSDWVYPGPTIDLQSPASAQAVDGTTYLIYAESLDRSQWEIATGAYTASSGTLARTTIKSNSLGTTAKINFGKSPQVYAFEITPSIAGLLQASNNLSDVNNPATALNNLSGVSYGAAQSLSAGQQEQARANIGASVGYPDVIVEEQTSSASVGATSGSFVTRGLSTLVRNNGTIAALASNQVTLGAGTYFFKWFAPGKGVNQHQTRLQNITDATTAGLGTSAFSPSASNAYSASEGSCVVTIAASKAFAVQHRVTTTNATDGFGTTAGFGTDVYSRLEITKLG